MNELTLEQCEVLQRADKSGAIYKDDYDICPGIHFCSDWDGLAICAASPEAIGCTCGRLRKFQSQQTARGNERDRAVEQQARDA